jgi:hypothetical protein
MIYLVAGILVIEVIRLILSIKQDKQITWMNQQSVIRSNKAIEVDKDREEIWNKLRKAEMEELKELAKGSKVLEDLIESLKAEK